MDREILWEVVSWVVAVVAFFISFIATNYVAEDHQPEVMFSTVFAVLTYLSTSELLRIRRYRQMERDLQALKSSQDSIREHEKSEHQLINTLHSLLRADSVLRETGYAALRNALGGFVIEREEPFIRVSGRELTFTSYQFFWHRMLDLQNEQKAQKAIRGRKVFLTARLTHSGRVEEWSKSPSLIEIKRIHRDFTRAGGKVYRIFLDNGKTGEIRSYVKAIREMLLAGVRCGYMRTKEGTDIKAEDFDGDFCIIDPQQYSSDWKNEDESHVASCEIGRRPSVFRANKRSWERLVAELERYRYEEGCGLCAEEVQFFQACRDHFLERKSSLTVEALVTAADACYHPTGGQQV